MRVGQKYRWQRRQAALRPDRGGGRRLGGATEGGSIMSRRVLIAAAAGALAATVLAGGVAWASIPDSGGVIQGCYTKGAGVLRVIDTAKGQKCPDAESPISWNQKGDPGPAGSPWPKGDP